MICDVKTAAWSSTTATSTGVRTSGVGEGVGVAEGARVGSGVGETVGSGVTMTVGIVERSGGGSMKFSTRAAQRSNRSPMPSTFA